MIQKARVPFAKSTIQNNTIIGQLHKHANRRGDHWSEQLHVKVLACLYDAVVGPLITECAHLASKLILQWFSFSLKYK